MRLCWASHGLINVSRIWMQPNFPITMETISSLLQQSIYMIANKRGRLRVFLELVPSTITRDLNVPFKMLCIWLVFSLCMLHCIGLIEVMMIYLCVLLMLKNQFGFITNFRSRNQAHSSIIVEHDQVRSSRTSTVTPFVLPCLCFWDLTISK